jgi:hypothetical protein
MQTRVTAVYFKNQAASENTIKDMQTEGYSIQQQEKDLYIERVNKRNVISQSYILPKKQAYRLRNTDADLDS